MAPGVVSSPSRRASGRHVPGEKGDLVGHREKWGTSQRVGVAVEEFRESGRRGVCRVLSAAGHAF
jgi:hypothetical protein